MAPSTTGTTTSGITTNNATSVMSSVDSPTTDPPTNYTTGMPDNSTATSIDTSAISTVTDSPAPTGSNITTTQSPPGRTHQSSTGANSTKSSTGFTTSASALKPKSSVPTTTSNNSISPRQSAPPSTRTCPNPGIKNGNVQPSPSGPYLPGTRLNVTCAAGFQLSGQLTIICSAVTASWTGPLPKCLPEDNGSHLDNNITIEDSNSVPLWLMIILAITVGVVCLFILTCLIVFCLRLCGCFQGPAVRPGTEALVSSGDTQLGGLLCCMGRKTTKQINVSPVPRREISFITTTQQAPHDGSRNIPPQGHHVENAEPISGGPPPPRTRPAYPGTSDEFGPRGNRQRVNRFMEPMIEPTYLPPNKRKARRPDMWLPHAQRARNNNTSTM